jgi:hypothetical protein
MPNLWEEVKYISANGAEVSPKQADNLIGAMLGSFKAWISYRSSRLMCLYIGQLYNLAVKAAITANILSHLYRLIFIALRT